MKKLLLFIPLLFLLLLQWVPAKKYGFTVPKGWPEPNINFTKEPLSIEKVELGRALFYDPILSRDSSTSCASCHSVYTAFTHVDHGLSHGINNKIGTRNAPALMNLAWHKLFMWDGAVNHIEVQALAPISNPVEMDEKIEHVTKKLQRTTLYPSLFRSAFNDSVITGQNTLKALGQFMLTLVSSNSKYDSVIRKQAKFTDQEENGYKLFKKNCASCHTEPLFTNLNFENNGLPMDPTLKDLGRMKITKNPSDSLKFKVPTLRNIEFSYPYMHDGRFKRLQDVLDHYAKGIQKSSTLSDRLAEPVVFSSNERVDLISFLLTLTDKNFLFNKHFAYPKNIYSSTRRKP